MRVRILDREGDDVTGWCGLELVAGEATTGAEMIGGHWRVPMGTLFEHLHVNQAGLMELTLELDEEF